jgi:hypothetical protein
VRVRRVSEDAWLLNKATKELRAQFIDVEYHGEGMATWVCRCTEAILVKKRRYLSKEQKHQRWSTRHTAMLARGVVRRSA